MPLPTRVDPIVTDLVNGVESAAPGSGERYAVLEATGAPPSPPESFVGRCKETSKRVARALGATALGVQFDLDEHEAKLTAKPDLELGEDEDGVPGGARIVSAKDTARALSEGRANASGNP